jgi:drug/metabolite transporter (DMT)-like permease
MNTGLGYVFVVLALLLWAGNAVIGRVAPDVNVPPLALNFWRWTIALFVLAPFAIPKLAAQHDLSMFPVFGAALGILPTVPLTITVVRAPLGY